MPDIETLLIDPPEDERLKKWREERANVAKAEKAERLRQRDMARQQEKEDAQRADERAALALLPTPADLAEMQAQIATRARRASRAFWMQAVLFCVAPVALAAYYLFAIATPLYEAQSVIAVTRAGSSSDTSNSGLLGGIASPDHMQEVFMAHEFIQSQAIMDQLEAQTGLVTQLSGVAIDPLRRLQDVPGLSYDKRDQFARFVDSTVNIQTGLITLYVRTPDKAGAVATSEQILGLVAAQVNMLNRDVIAQQLALADQTVIAAQSDLTAAQSDMINLQIASGEADPSVRIAGVYDTISQLEAEVLTLSNDIQRAEIAGQSESFQNQRAMALRDRLVAQIAEERAVLVSGETSLNAQMQQHHLAALRVSIAEEALTSSLTSQAEAHHAAALTASLFQVVVPPRTSAQPMAPNIPGTLLIVAVIAMGVFALWRVAIGGRQTI
jgi:capsule polysaccharide export protein KpsE/RkpR